VRAARRAARIKTTTTTIIRLRQKRREKRGMRSMCTTTPLHQSLSKVCRSPTHPRSLFKIAVLALYLHCPPFLLALSTLAPEQQRFSCLGGWMQLPNRHEKQIHADLLAWSSCMPAQVALLTSLGSGLGWVSVFVCVFVCVCVCVCTYVCVRVCVCMCVCIYV
jgi:hypothetical protein